MRLLAAVLVVFGCLAISSVSAQSPPTFAPLEFRPAIGGDPEVVDGDTLWLGIHEIRLFGIDAVEDGQTCRDASNRSFDCFGRSRQELENWVSKPGFRCIGMVGKDGKPRRSYGRYLATCKVGDIEVNRALVESGWAFAVEYAGDARRKIDPCGLKGAEAFLEYEKGARNGKRGLHAMKVDLDHPCRWRKAENGRNCPTGSLDDDDT